VSSQNVRKSLTKGTSKLGGAQGKNLALWFPQYLVRMTRNEQSALQNAKRCAITLGPLLKLRHKTANLTERCQSSFKGITLAKRGNCNNLQS